LVESPLTLESTYIINISNLRRLFAISIYIYSKYYTLPMRKVRILLFLILVSLSVFLGQFSFTVFAQTPTKICNASFGATWYGQVYVKGYLEIKDSAGGCLTGIAGQTVTSSYMYKTWGPNGCYYSDYYGQGTTGQVQVIITFSMVHGELQRYFR